MIAECLRVCTGRSVPWQCAPVTGSRIAEGALATAREVRAAAPARVGAALRAALAVAVPLAVGAATGHPQQGAAAAFGALGVVYVPQSPYRYRARVVAAVGGGLVIAVLLGALAADRGWAAVLVSGVVAGAASFVCQGAELPPPRELMLVMAVLAATDVSAGPAQAAGRAGPAAAGAVLAWMITMAPALLGRHRPEERAGAAAFGAIAGLLDGVGSPAVRSARHGAVTAVRRARLAVGQAGRGPEDPLVRRVIAVEVLLEAVLHVEVEAAGSLDPGWAAAVRALAGAGGGGPLPDPEGTVGADQLARAVEEARTMQTGRAMPLGTRSLPARPGLAAQLAAALRRHSVVLPTAARIGIAVAVGVGVGRALGLGHAYWVGLTTAAVLQGSNLAVTRKRVVHRVVGTVVGVALTFAVLGWAPPVGVVVLAAVVAQFGIELVIATHYGLAVTAITVLSLALFHLGAPGEDVGAALWARLLDTGIGAVLALLLRRVLWPRATSLRLPALQARVVAGVRAVFGAAWAGSDALPQRRRALQAELAALRAVHADALADADDTGPDVRWPVSAAAEELAFLALSLPPHRRPPPPDTARAFLDQLDALGTAVAAGTAPPPDRPAVTGHPRTSAAAAALADAVSEAAAAR
jgi:uncharacterized membrane protein YccC